MKLQIQEQRLRFRVDEAELAALLDGAAVINRTTLPDGTQFAQSLALAESGEAVWACASGAWYLSLPRAAVQAHAERLPCKEALSFSLDALQLSFEVDVRDSLRRRLGTK